MVSTTAVDEIKYELMVILNPDLSEADTDKELGDLRKLIKEADGKIYHEDIWNVRNMAYRIKKNDKGFYVIFYFTFTPEKMKELEKSLLLNQKVLRHLVIKSPKNYQIKPLSELELTEEERKRPRKEEDRGTRGGFKAPKRPMAPSATAPAKKVEKPVKEEVKESKAKKEEKPAIDISDLDSKLESILDDSDLKL